MCGILGLVSKQIVTDGDLNRLRIISEALTHRGPNGQGLWRDERVALGHRRLAILDLTKAGTQPMQCLEGRYVIVFNGEIFNFLELKRELMAKGYFFKTDTDTEVIAASYDAWGVDCLHRFNGMWAFALWDVRSKELFLARDRYGIKPLYYSREKDFVFASEIKVLHRWLGDSARLDEEILIATCQGSRAYSGTEKTYIKQVLSLPAGSAALLKDGNFRLFRWYNLRQVTVPLSLYDQAERFRELFIDACRIRLRSDVPIATCLSGGLDSGSIVSALHKVLRYENGERTSGDFHKAFCTSFPGAMTDEAHLARTLTDDLDVRLYIKDLVSPDLDTFEKIMHTCDGPMPNLAFYPITEMFRFVHEYGIKVTMDGLGPDEMLGGYRPLFDALQVALKKGNLRWAWDVYRTYREQGEFEYYSARRIARAELFSALSSELFYPLMRVKNLAKRLLTQETLYGGKKPGVPYTSPLPGDLDGFQNNLYKGFFRCTLPMLLHQQDRCSMAYGVESRMPFMDYRLVEFAFSLPNESRVGGGYTKRILREAMKGILPEEIRMRKTKIGFHVPQVDWFRGPLKEWIQDVMSSQCFLKSALFDGRGLKRDFQYFLDTHNDMHTWDLAGKFWGPIHLTWWLENHKVSDEIASSPSASAELLSRPASADKSAPRNGGGKV